MKQLYLVRHARAEAGSALVKDFDRPLSDRGRQDLPLMARRWLERGDALPEGVLCSPARRTRETAELLLHALGVSDDRIQQDGQVYLAGEARLLQLCRQFPDDRDVMMLVGHNPAITDVLNLLCDNVRVDHMPPGGVACLRLSIDSWKEVAVDGGELLTFDYPDRVLPR